MNAATALIAGALSDFCYIHDANFQPDDGGFYKRDETINDSPGC